MVSFLSCGVNQTYFTGGKSCLSSLASFCSFVCVNPVFWYDSFWQEK